MVIEEKEYEVDNLRASINNIEQKGDSIIEGLEIKAKEVKALKKGLLLLGNNPADSTCSITKLKSNWTQ